MQEIWKDVIGFEGGYQVSNFGNVKSLSRVVPCKGGTRKTSERLCNPSYDKDGYRFVSLSFNGKRKNSRLHRIVAEAFIPNTNNLPQVNHKDGNKNNNCSENLEWCTSQENIVHSLRTGLKKIHSVNQFSLDGVLIKKWDTITKASIELGIKRKHIERCLFGGSKTCHGYIFSYCENVEPYKPTKLANSSIKVFKFDTNRNLVKVYDSISKAEAEEHIIHKTFRNYCNTGKIYKNFYWELEGE